jgi:hypothetical protein
MGGACEDGASESGTEASRWGWKCGSLRMRQMRQGVLSRLDVAYHPTSVAFRIPFFVRGIRAAERELWLRARYDTDNCFGYFPALAGTEGILCDLPACRTLAAAVPQITHDGWLYRFNFLRMSLVQQSCHPEFHLDSDAATALSGDVETISRRCVWRMVLNLSATNQRALHYLDIDSASVELIVRGGYVSVSRTEFLGEKVLTAVIPPRRGASVHGLVFPSNRVLHSGIDDECGHFIAAYGMETGEAQSESSSDEG